jgi:hypothetical protein
MSQCHRVLEKVLQLDEVKKKERVKLAQTTQPHLLTSLSVKTNDQRSVVFSKQKGPIINNFVDGQEASNDGPEIST